MEDMYLLFGDASAAITPATQAERGSLMGAGSPVPSLDIRRQYGQPGAEGAIPSLEIGPSNVGNDGITKTGRSPPREDTAGRSDGIRSWISNMVTRHKGSQHGVHNTQYKRLGQDEEE